MLPSTQPLILKERGNDLTKSMLFLMNLKNNNAKKDLHLAYSQGNKTAYPLSIKAMARYISTQYPSKNSGHQHKGKKGDRNGKKGMIQNLKTRTTILQEIQVHTLEMLQHLKIPLLLAGGGGGIV